jgi:hypothetical protein
LEGGSDGSEHVAPDTGIGKDKISHRLAKYKQSSLRISQEIMWMQHSSQELDELASFVEKIPSGYCKACVDPLETTESR